MRMAGASGRRRKTRSKIVMVALSWLAAQVTGCSLLADLDLPENGASPGGGDASNSPPDPNPPLDGGFPVDTSVPDDQETGAPSDAARNDAKPPPPPPPPPPTYANEVMADQPSAYWRLGESSGTTAKDSAGSTPGTYEQGFGLRAGGVLSNDTAVRLDGQSGTRIRFGDIFDFNENAPCTLEAWAKWEGGGTGNVFSKRADDRGGTGYALSVSNVNGKHQWSYLRQNGDNGDSATFQATATTGFVHVVATYDGTVGRLYLNGTEVANTSFRDSLVGGQSSLFLGNSAAGNGAFQGTLDELAIYTHVVSADRIKVHYQAANSK